MAVMDEFFDIVTDDDVVIGQASRRSCHGNPELIHRAVHVLVFNPGGKLLLQQRSHQKDIQPGKWDTSVGGHLEPGESYLAAAHREMAEELGLAGLPLTFLYHSKIRNHVESENIATYLTLTDRDIFHDPGEISSVRFWSHAEVEDSLGYEVFTPNFEDEWRMLKSFTRRYLESDSEGTGLCSDATFPALWQKLCKDLPVSV